MISRYSVRGTRENKKLVQVRSESPRVELCRGGGEFVFWVRTFGLYSGEIGGYYIVSINLLDGRNCHGVRHDDESLLDVIGDLRKWRVVRMREE